MAKPNNNLMEELTSTLLSMTDEQLKSIPHAALYAAREYAPKAEQNKLAAAEHRAFSREIVADNPLMALPLTAAVPAYQLYKMFAGARSDPSLNQFEQGYAGIGDGLVQSLSDLFK